MLKLLGNRILFRPDPTSNGNGSLIHMPGSVKAQKQAFGTVAMVGSRNKESLLEVGHRVRIDTNFGSIEVLHEGKPHRIVSVSDVQMILGT